jgi:hypothetical protein
VAVLWIAIWLPSAFAQSETKQATPGELQQKKDYFRIVGEVEFEGEHVSYDDIIETYVVAETNGEMGEDRSNNRLYMSRRWVLRRLASGQLLAMKVPHAAGLWSDAEGVTPRDPRWDDPKYVQYFLRPPDEFLPQFYWIDSLSSPRAAEGYVSAFYYKQSFARLKIVKPIKLEFVVPSERAHDLAEQQRLSEPDFQLNPGQTEGSSDWWALSLQPVDKAVWSKMPKVSDTIRAHLEEQLILFDYKTVQEIWKAVGRKARRHWQVRNGDFGVAQPDKYPFPQNEGLLYGEGTGGYGDAIIPTKCTPPRPVVCDPLQGRVAFLAYTPHPGFQNGFRLRIGGLVIDVPGAGAVYDRKSDALYILGFDEF